MDEAENAFERAGVTDASEACGGAGVIFKSSTTF
jgi:hypothetical protein